MVTISVEGDRVRFDVQGWDKLWALKSQLDRARLSLPSCTMPRWFDENVTATSRDGYTLREIFSIARSFDR